MLANPDAVPELEIVAPEAIVIVAPEGSVNVSPLSPNVVVPHAVLGLSLFTFISLIIFSIDIYILILQFRYHHFQQD